MFKECPRKLADVVVNDDLAYVAPARQPPEAREIMTMYKDSWGKMDLSDPPIPQGCTSGDLMHEYFPPIIAEGFNKRIRKMRIKTAADPDGMEKKHLLTPGLPNVEMKLHILGLCQYTKGSRIKTHNEVKVLLVKKVIRQE